MNRIQFKQLFEKALEEVAQKTEQKYGIQIPRNFKIYLANKASPKTGFLSVEEATNWLYIDENSSHYVIDLLVDGINSGENYSLVVAIPSSHHAVEFSKTWNYTIGLGPFKVLVPLELKSIKPKD